MPMLSFSTRVFPCCWRALVLLALFLMIAGCGAEDVAPPVDPSDTAPAACPPGTAPVDGGCQEAGLPPGVTAGLPPDMPCPPGEAPLEGGGCQPAGVPPDACGQGFEPDGRGGCDPILPEGPCPPGLMAVPGDVACREVAPCGDGDYGTIPVDATTQFVNAAYAGDDSDGTRAKPWRHIQDGIDHARSGAIVAVAAGRYLEDVLVRGKPVRVWGRCPAMVEIAGAGAAIATLEVLDERASESGIHNLAVTGRRDGISTSGAEHVLLDRVWIHDTTGRGLDIEAALGPTSVTTSASLIEETRELGVLVSGSEATVEATVVRGTRPSSAGAGGTGIVIHNGSTRNRGETTLRNALLEHNRGHGVAVYGSEVTVEATVVRDTQPDADGRYGRGIQVASDDTTHERGALTLRTSLLEHNHEAGVLISGSDATIEATVVRDTEPRSDGTLGIGVEVGQDSAAHERAKATLRASLLEHNHEAGVRVAGSDATIEATVVRDTQPDARGAGGKGITLADDPETHDHATMTLRASLLEQNHEVGVLVMGSDATVEATVVRGPQAASDGTGGRGIDIVNDPGTKERATVTLRASLLEQNHGVGVLVMGSDATAEATVVRDTQPGGDEGHGAGILLVGLKDDPKRATLTLRASLLEQNHGEGVLVQSADATIESTIVRDTKPGDDGLWGAGIVIQKRGVTVLDDAAAQERATMTLRASLLERNHDVGVLVLGSDATMEATVVRDTQPNNAGQRGIGITAEWSSSDHDPARLKILTSLLEQNHDMGIDVFNSNATIEATVVRDTRAERDGTSGDGISVFSRGAPANVTVSSTRVESNARAGISNFSAAVTLTSSVVQCNRIDLNGEDIVEGQPFTFDCASGNLFGCDTPDPTCVVLSKGLTPPEPIDPIRSSR
ncbi:hypothetical protein [Sorangium sp. So ce131]|uniref:hypothetical protein n=1 Tax=Sorangium sp. So ce131 TaxID=3133282 RepID=UPI003F61F0FB